MEKSSREERERLSENAKLDLYLGSCRFVGLNEMNGPFDAAAFILGDGIL